MIRQRIGLPASRVSCDLMKPSAGNILQRGQEVCIGFPEMARMVRHTSVLKPPVAGDVLPRPLIVSALMCCAAGAALEQVAHVQ